LRHANEKFRRAMGSHATKEQSMSRLLFLCAAGVILSVAASSRGQLTADKDKEALLAAYKRAQAFQKAGKLDEAAKEYEKAIALAHQVFGPDHANTAVLLHNLGVVYQFMKQYAKAEEVFQRSLKIAETKLGKDSLAVAHSLNGLAVVSHLSGQYAKAEPLY